MDVHAVSFSYVTMQSVFVSTQLIHYKNIQTTGCVCKAHYGFILQ